MSNYTLKNAIRSSNKFKISTGKCNGTETESYKLWIDKNFPDAETSAHKCHYAVKKMLIAFPELEIRSGTCNGVAHCWLTDVERSTIVDPTFRQFTATPMYYVSPPLAESDISTSVRMMRGVLNE